MDKCYMCDANGTTQEHAPPRSFFPVGHRRELIKVPSCEAHNNEFSDDVEYVRNIIVSQLSTKKIARTHFQDKVLRSYQRNTKLTNRTFSRITPIIVNGQHSVIAEIEMDKFRLIISAVAYALYRKDFMENFAGLWNIFCPQLLNTQRFLQGLPDGFEAFRAALSKLTFLERLTGNPEVFKYGFCRHANTNMYLYRFEFYEGFVVYAMGENGKS